MENVGKAQGASAVATPTCFIRTAVIKEPAISLADHSFHKNQASTLVGSFLSKRTQPVE
jgi:hypothetical protein